MVFLLKGRFGTMKLWSWRNRASGGKWWVYERDVSPENASQWLNVFQNDEPEITLKISKKKPNDLNK